LSVFIVFAFRLSRKSENRQGILILPVFSVIVAVGWVDRLRCKRVLGVVMVMLRTYTNNVKAKPNTMQDGLHNGCWVSLLVAGMISISKISILLQDVFSAQALNPTYTYAVGDGSRRSVLSVSIAHLIHKIR